METKQTKQTKPEEAPVEKEDICPETDPEHGDLTPAYTMWYSRNHTRVEFHAKYGDRLNLIPDEIRARLGGIA